MSVTSATSSITKVLVDLEQGSFSDSERNELVLGLREALAKIETPWQRIQALIWENSAHAAALKIAHDVGLFQAWVKDGSEQLGIEELSKVVQHPIDLALLDRVLRALTYKGTLTSPGQNVYSLTPFSKALGDSMMGATLDYWFDFQIPALSNLPAFLKSTSYKLPSDPAHTAWNQAMNDPTPFFGWLQQRPEKMMIFGQVMQCYSASQPSWVDLYPSDKLLANYDPATPLVVDLGGGQGHDLQKFVKKHSPPAGSCYLQDQAEVLKNAIPSEAIVTRSIDFFKETPVQGARVYYLHSVLHDWTDEQCRQILANVEEAMHENLSKVLIHELIRLEDSSRDLASLGEFTVMSILGAPERSEKQWRSLVESAGLRVVQVYSHPLSTHSILEVEK